MQYVSLTVSAQEDNFDPTDSSLNSAELAFVVEEIFPVTKILTIMKFQVIPKSHPHNKPKRKFLSSLSNTLFQDKLVH